MAKSSRDLFLLHWSDIFTFRRRFTLKSKHKPTEIAKQLSDIALPPPADNNPLHAVPTLILPRPIDGRYTFELHITRGLPIGGTFTGIFASGTITTIGEETLVSGDIAMTRRGLQVYGMFLVIWLLWAAISWSTAHVSPLVGYTPVWVALAMFVVFGLYVISLQYRDLRRIVRLLRSVRD